MRTVSDNISVRLYHLDDQGEGGTATTLFYGPLHKAMEIAGEQPSDIQAGLYLATDNDVVSFLDLANG